MWTEFLRRGRALLIAGLLGSAAAAVGGCSREDYYCGETACYYCDGVGCREAQPPVRTSCQGVWECAASQVCTDSGCANTCTTDAQCSQGWVCRPIETGSSTMVCVAPSETVTPHPGTCTSNNQCMGGTICLDGECTRTTSPACTQDAQCTAGNVCVDGRCTPSADTCQFSNECGSNRVCVDAQCRPRCTSNAMCPAGQTCDTSTGIGYCRDGTASGCTVDGQCSAGQRCLNGECLVQCTPGATSCPSAEQYCSDDGVCVLDTRPRPFCDDAHPCSSGSSCVDGICRISCSTADMCLRVDFNLVSCALPPGVSSGGTYCLTANEAQPRCARQTDCAQSEVCIDATCR